MEDIVLKVKLSGCLVLALLAPLVGGIDDLLLLLIALAGLDIITGVVVAMIGKELSSKAMTLGIVKKVMLGLVIMLSCLMDKVWVNIAGDVLKVCGREVTIRTLFISYMCLEEGISLLENFGNIGVPYPKWLKGMLVQISDGVNNSTPTQVIIFINKYLGDKFISANMFKEEGDSSKEEADPDTDIKECTIEEVEVEEEEESC